VELPSSQLLGSDADANDEDGPYAQSLSPPVPTPVVLPQETPASTPAPPPPTLTAADVHAQLQHGLQMLNAFARQHNLDVSAFAALPADSARAASATGTLPGPSPAASGTGSTVAAGSTVVTATAASTTSASPRSASAPPPPVAAPLQPAASTFASASAVVTESIAAASAAPTSAQARDAFVQGAKAVDFHNRKGPFEIYAVTAFRADPAAHPPTAAYVLALVKAHYRTILPFVSGVSLEAYTATDEDLTKNNYYGHKEYEPALSHLLRKSSHVFGFDAEAVVAAMIDAYGGDWSHGPKAISVDDLVTSLRARSPHAWERARELTRARGTKPKDIAPARVGSFTASRRPAGSSRTSQRARRAAPATAAPSTTPAPVRFVGGPQGLQSATLAQLHAVLTGNPTSSPPASAAAASAVLVSAPSTGNSTLSPATPTSTPATAALPSSSAALVPARRSHDPDTQERRTRPRRDDSTWPLCRNYEHSRFCPFFARGRCRYRHPAGFNFESA